MPDVADTGTRREGKEACFMDFRRRSWNEGSDVRYEVLPKGKGAKERLEAATANLADGLSSLRLG